MQTLDKIKYSKKVFYIFHTFIVIFTVWIISVDFFALKKGMLSHYTRESGFYELGSGLFLFLFGLYLLNQFNNVKNKNLKIGVVFTGFVLILGALEELSWGQHLLGYQSAEFFTEHNNQHEMNLHNFIPNWFFGLMVNLSFYIFFVYIPILFYFFQERIFVGFLQKFSYLSDYLPPLELVPVFLFGFALQKYFILDTYTDTIALVVALILLVYIAIQKREKLFSIHVTLLVLLSVYFMYAHEIFSYKNLQYEIREFVFIYTMVFWLYGVMRLLKKQKL